MSETSVTGSGISSPSARRQAVLGSSYGSRSSAPNWSKLLQPGGQSQRGRTIPPKPAQDGDRNPSRPISRESSSYFLGPSKLGSRQSSTTSLGKLSEQPTWQTSDIEEFLKRRSTDADGSPPLDRESSEFERWMASATAKTSYQLPMFTLPAEGQEMLPQPRSTYQAGAASTKDEAMDQLKALQQAAVLLIAQATEEQQEEEAGEGIGAAEAVSAGQASAAGAAAASTESTGAAAYSTPPRTAAGLSGASASAARAPPDSTSRYGLAGAASPFSPAYSIARSTPGRSPGSGSRRSAALPSKPPGTPAYGCITTPHSAVVARQPGSSSTVRSRSGTPAAEQQQVANSIASHLQQLKLLQQQADRLFA